MVNYRFVAVSATSLEKLADRVQETHDERVEGETINDVSYSILISNTITYLAFITYEITVE